MHLPIIKRTNLKEENSMRKFKSLVCIMLVFLLAMSLFAGCSKQADKTEDQQPATTKEETETKDEKQEEKKVEGTVTVCIDIQAKTTYNQFIKRFEEKHPGIKINALYGKDQNTLIAAGQAPDLIKTGDVHLVASKDSMLDLTPYIERDKDEVQLDDFFPNTIEPLKIDGKYLALPTTFNVGLLYYNKKLFDEANVPYPTKDWTMNDFLDAAKKLTKQDDSGKYVQWGVSTVLGWWGEWLIHVRQAGGDWMQDGKCVLDTPEAISGLKYFFDKTTKGEYKVSPSTTDDALGGFAGGKTAMEYGGHTGLWLSYNSTADLDWDIEVLPSGLARKEGGEFAVEAYGIHKDTKVPEAAWEVLKFWAGKEGCELMADMGRPAPRKSVAELVLSVPKEERSNPKNMEALYEAVGTGMTLPTDPNFVPCTQQVVQPIIDKMLEGKLTPEEAAKEATIKANEYLEANR